VANSAAIENIIMITIETTLAIFIMLGISSLALFWAKKIRVPHTVQEAALEDIFKKELIIPKLFITLRDVQSLKQKTGLWLSLASFYSID
jgi:hypothetical protein